MQPQGCFLGAARDPRVYCAFAGSIGLALARAMSNPPGCLDENTIVAFFESRLEDGARARADEHLASCRACRDLLAAYAAMAPVPNVTAPMQPGASVPASAPLNRDERADIGRRVAQAQAARRIGTTLCGKWTLERLIGIGGMAQVFQATHRNGRAVAVKVMRPELAVEPLFVERFLREGYVANKVDHPGAVAILDDDLASDGAPFLVMELLRGRTLASRLRETGCLPVADALRVVASVLDVLAAAHDKGIVHRDIKPENLFETEGGDTKVLDFGIARLRDGMGQRGNTEGGVTMGTLGYMPPEQARGQGDALDARSDLWAVGATLLTLTTGLTLHDAATPNEALLLAMTAPIRPVQTLAPGLPSAVAALLDTALAFDKAARFTDARAMRQAVEGARRSSEVMAALHGPSISGTLSGLPPPHLLPTLGSMPGVSAPASPSDRASGTSEASADVAQTPASAPAPPRGKRALLGVLVTVAVLGSAAAVTLRVVGGPGTGSRPVLPASAPPSAQAEPTLVAATAPPPPASAPQAAASEETAAPTPPTDAAPHAPPSTTARPLLSPRPPRTPRPDASPAPEPSAHPYLDPLGPRR